MKETSHEQLQVYWKRTKILIQLLLKKIYNFSYDVAPEIEGNYIVLSNHFGTLDPWLLSLGFEKQMYFLAGEHVFRLGFLSWIVKKFWKPLSITKGKVDVTAMMKVMRYLKNGYNISLFPEGNRSFNGKTEEIASSIGKLVKVGGSSLITYRFEGMYFTTPRWGKILRRGKTHATLVNVYTKEQLKNMSAKEVTQHIVADLTADAYEVQEKNPVAFKSKTRAEGIESLFFMCPKCNKIRTICSKKEYFWCSECTSKAEYTEYGYLKGDFGYTKIIDWDNWQLDQLKNIVQIAIKNNSTQPILECDNLDLKVIEQSHKEKLISHGRFSLFIDKLVVGTTEIKLDEIIEMEVAMRNKIVFSTKNNENYQIFSKKFTNARSFVRAHMLICENQIKTTQEDL